MKQRGGAEQLGFFSQVPTLSDLRQENWRRTQQHYGQPPSRPFPGPKQQHGSGRPGGGHRRARGSKGTKQLKMAPLPAPRPITLTPAGNPLDTPANVGKAAAAAPGGGAGGKLLEVEGLQAGLDWYGTNENSTALFLTGQQMTTSDSEGEGEEYGEEGEGSEGEAGGGGGQNEHAANGSGGERAVVDDASLPRHVRARLVEQEAYIAELEDQNLRLREQLEMAQQEMEDLRHRGGGMADSEEGFAEHSEGSLPGDLSVMQHQHHSQQHHSQVQ